MQVVWVLCSVVLQRSEGSFPSSSTAVVSFASPYTIPSSLPLISSPSSLTSTPSSPTSTPSPQTPYPTPPPPPPLPPFPSLPPSRTKKARARGTFLGEMRAGGARKTVGLFAPFLQTIRCFEPCVPRFSRATREEPCGDNAIAEGTGHSL